MQNNKGEQSTGLKREFSLLGAFFSVGIVGQVSSVIVGLLIIRSLTKTEYAYYSLFFSLIAALLQFTDLGVISGAMGAGGKRYGNRSEFSAVIATTRRFRWMLLGAGGIPLAGWGFWLIHVKNGAPLILSVWLLLALVLLGFFSLEKTVFQLVPKLAGHHRFLFKVGLALPLTRLGLGLGLYLTFLNLNTALVLFAFMLVLEYLLYRRRVAESIDLNASPDPEVREEILKVVKRQGVNTGFFVLFSQISLWLISIFGSTDNVAEVGALGRLSLVMAILLPILDNLVYPRVSKSREAGEMIRQVYGGLLMILGLGAVLLLAVFYFQQPMLSLLGKAYLDLGNELMWVALAVLLQGCSTLFLQANAARGWVMSPVVRIPIRVVTLILFVMMVDVSTVAGVIQLQVLSHTAEMVSYAVYFHYKAARHARGVYQ